MAAIASEPGAFDLFQAIRRLDAAFPDCARTGRSDSPAREPVRFSQEPALGFALRLIERFHPGGGPGAPARFDLNHHGLVGPNGPLPIHLTEYARERLRHHADPTFLRFLDVFIHRFVSFLYRAWADSQIALDLDRAAEDERRYTDFVGAFAGIGLPSLRGRDGLHDFARLHYSTWLCGQTRPAEGLEKILADFFAVPVEIETFIGRWIDLPQDSRCQLGRRESGGQLGLSAFAGERTWTRQLAFRIRLGPVGLATAERFLPGTPACERLRCWVRTYLGFELFWDVQIVVLAAEVPPIRLGGTNRLGYTTWSRSAPLAHDSADLIFSPETAS